MLVEKLEFGGEVSANAFVGVLMNADSLFWVFTIIADSEEKNNAMLIGTAILESGRRQGCLLKIHKFRI